MYIPNFHTDRPSHLWHFLDKSSVDETAEQVLGKSGW